MGDVSTLESGHFRRRPTGRKHPRDRQQAAGKDNRLSIGTPASTTAIDDIAHTHRSATGYFDLFQGVFNKECDEAAIWRPERERRSFCADQLLGDQGIERPN